MKKCLYYGQLLALMLVIMLATSCTVSGETALDKYIKKGELRLEEQSLLNAASSGARLLSLSPSGRYVIALEQYAGMSAIWYAAERIRAAVCSRMVCFGVKTICCWAGSYIILLG